MSYRELMFPPPESRVRDHTLTRAPSRAMQPTVLLTMQRTSANDVANRKLRPVRLSGDGLQFPGLPDQQVCLRRSHAAR